MIRVTATALCLTITLGGCAAPGVTSLITKRPTAWTDEDKVSFAQISKQDPHGPVFLSLCNSYRTGRATFDTLTAADFGKYETIFRQVGLTNRDIELIRMRSKSFGTGQTFNGMVCSTGIEPEVNKSFYQGLGHRWQAIMPGQFIYLEGDGTRAGMRVTSWN